MLDKLQNVKLPFKVNQPFIIIIIGVAVAIFGFIFIRAMGGYLTNRVSQQMKLSDLTKNAGQFTDVPGFQQLEIEKEMELRVQRVLDEIVGPRKSVVRVSIELTPEIQNREEVNTPKPISTSQQEKVSVSAERGGNKASSQKENTSKAVTVREKLPGMDSDIEIRGEEDYFIYPGYPVIGSLTSKKAFGTLPNFGGAQEKAGTEATKESSNTEYTLDKKMMRTITPAGSIGKVTVFAVVDVIWKKAFTGKVRPIKRSEKELEQYKALIQSTIGYNEARGDKIEILNIPFTGARPAIEMMEKITTGITILVLLPLLYFIVKATLNFIKRRAEEKQEMEERVRREEEEEKAKKEKEEREKREAIQMHQEQVFTIGRTHPDICARIVRNWLT